mgnify:CR=1 FL=1
MEDRDAQASLPYFMKMDLSSLCQENNTWLSIKTHGTKEPTFCTCNCQLELGSVCLKTRMKHLAMNKLQKSLLPLYVCSTIDSPAIDQEICIWPAMATLQFSTATWLRELSITMKTPSRSFQERSIWKVYCLEIHVWLPTNVMLQDHTKNPTTTMSFCTRGPSSPTRCSKISRQSVLWDTIVLNVTIKGNF